MKLKLKKKMKLKLNKQKIKNKNNLYVALYITLIISTILGIIYFYTMNNKDITNATNNITNYINSTNTKINYNFKNNLFQTLIQNISLTFTIWLLGLSIIGIPIIISILIFKGFSLGFLIATIIKTYKAKGIIGILLYMFPDKILSLILYITISFFAIFFSLKLIKTIYKKESTSYKKLLNKYIKILIVAIIITIFITILEVFINPYMIKLFTFFLK